MVTLTLSIAEGEAESIYVFGLLLFNDEITQ
jgi:hypothetical protein